MAADDPELSRRTKVALEAIKHSLTTPAGEFGAALFVTHHLEELEAAYWQAHLQTGKPSPTQVIGLLALLSHWSDDDDDGIDTLDFGLPGDVSSYRLSVRFNEHGDIDDVAMES